MDRKFREERCKWATERVNNILGGDSYRFEYNEKEWRFEFWEDRATITQMIFPLTLGNTPLPDITDWEIRHAVNFVRRLRREEAQKRFLQQKEYEKWEKNHSKQSKISVN